MIRGRHIIITGGAGYIGSLLSACLLDEGFWVTVIDDLLFGGDSILPLLHRPNFRFCKADVTQRRAVKDALRSVSANSANWPEPEAVIHLAGIVGFPACQAVGKQVAWAFNVDATKLVHEQAVEIGAARFIFASSYSNYGLAAGGKPVTEDSALNPQSLYAETKIAAEEFLMRNSNSSSAPVIFRFATLYGLSPRTRFDLIVNQFVLEAFMHRRLVIYQRGYSRSFVHVRDVVSAIMKALDAPAATVHGQIFNVGSDSGNLTKDEIVALVLRRLPETEIEYRDLTFGGDMRDITVSFDKIRRFLAFEPALTVDDGIRDLLFALRSGLIRDPRDERYRNAQFIVQ